MTPISTLGAWLLLGSAVLLIVLTTFLERMPYERREDTITGLTIPETVGAPLLLLALVGTLVGSALFGGC